MGFHIRSESEIAVALVFHLLIVFSQVTGKSITGSEQTLTDEVKAGIKGCRVCWRGMDTEPRCSTYSYQSFKPTIEVPWNWDVAYWVECENPKEDSRPEFEGELEMAEPFALKGCHICWRGYDTSEAFSCSKFSHESPPQHTNFVPFNWDVAFWVDCINLNNNSRTSHDAVTNDITQVNTYETATSPRLLKGCRVCWMESGENTSCSGFSNQGSTPTAYVDFTWSVRFWIECIRENDMA